MRTRKYVKQNLDYQTRKQNNIIYFFEKTILNPDQKF
jgi:hypothetical protein